MGHLGTGHLGHPTVKQVCNQNSVTNNLTKVETINPRDIKKIGIDSHRLPHEIEIENPYRDAVLLNEMAKATSKEEVNFIECFLKK